MKYVESTQWTILKILLWRTNLNHERQLRLLNLLLIHYPWKNSMKMLSRLIDWLKKFWTTNFGEWTSICRRQRFLEGNYGTRTNEGMQNEVSNHHNHYHLVVTLCLLVACISGTYIGSLSLQVSNNEVFSLLTFPLFSWQWDRESTRWLMERKRTRESAMQSCVRKSKETLGLQKDCT